MESWEDKSMHSAYEPGSLFNWLNILFHDFPREQIMVAGEITSNNPTDITIPQPHVGKQRQQIERERIKIPFSSSCLPGALCLIALLLMKCWCNYKKEALFLVPFLSFRLDWGHGTEHSLCPFASYFKQTYFVSLSVHWSSPSHHLLLPSVMLHEEQVGRLN